MAHTSCLFNELAFLYNKDHDIYTYLLTYVQCKFILNV